ncbi:transcriptional adapter 2B [Bacillus rossius redtenbacheri]|uniref:transcriptional adapter 2B n=1 Tax=Bacillus rossius redtenbacheri TaxID=93214 RepID=UPI002FDDF484
MADLFAKYTCTYCQEDITGLRIKCADCTNFDLCLQCFSSGAEIGQHKNTHAYQFMHSEPIGVGQARGGWSAREELHLLDAIEQFGFGNWEDISQHIETRGPEEAKDQYIARYLDGSIGRLTWAAAISLRPKLVDDAAPDLGPLSPAAASHLPPLDATPEEAMQLGYMPQRDDFEREYDNLAESLVSPLFINSLEDDELDVALKLCQVDMYNRRLRERARRRRVSRDYQLVSQYFSSVRKDRLTSRKKLSKEERELYDRMRTFTKFHTAPEHDQLLQSLLKERQMKVRLGELAKYRRSGLTRHEECPHFEQLRLQHDEWRERRSGSSGSYLSPTSTQLPKKGRDGAAAPASASGSCSQPSCDREGESDGRALGSAELETLPGFHLLTAYEIELCSSLNLKPSRYMALKSILMREFLKKGLKKEDLLTNTLGMESRILHYLVSSGGWITAS